MVEKTYERLSLNPWSKLTKVDLASSYEILSKQTAFAIDRENTTYSEWLKQGFLQALHLSDDVKSAIDYQYVMRYYISGFQDTHINIIFNKKIAPSEVNMEWPGFVVRYDQGVFAVQSENKTIQIENNVPPSGAVLIECDGLSPDALMGKNVFPYGGNSNLYVSYLMMTRRLMMYDGNSFVKKIKNCRFLYNGRRYDLDLAWHVISKTDWQFIKSQDYQPPNLKFRIKKLSNNIILLTVPTFGLFSEKPILKYNNFLKQIPSLRSKSKIVIDLRGNDGGDSALGDELLTSLYGRYAMYEKINYEKNQYELWRASSGNLQYIEQMAVPLAEKKYGKASGNYKYYVVLKQTIQNALKTNNELAMIDAFAKNQALEAEGKPENLYKGSLYLLTDRMCVSACLDFIGDALRMPNTMLVGESTNADTAYIDNRRETLSSGYAQISFPMKVIRNRVRKNNQPFIPQYEYSKDITNTALVEKWLLIFLSKNN
ncbi:TPA: hypothetical protein DIC20_01700 [Candidatus Dependentiae bacterium]|nr:hypothetical protein [Candidatus Dependentiae bacterium]